MKKGKPELNTEESTTESQSTNVLATITATQLIDVSSWRDRQLKLLVDNPFFEITDNKTYELGKKHRTNVVKGRTELQNQEKLVTSKFAAIRKEVGTETATLIDLTLPLETKWQEEVKGWEDRKARLKKEEEEKEALREKTIRDKIDSIEDSSLVIISKMTFTDIDKVKDELSKLRDDEFDFEEFDVLLDQVLDRITNSYEFKVDSLTKNENQRLDNERLEKENKAAKDREELQSSRLTEIMPYVAFGESVDLTKLSEMDIDSYQGILASKKDLFEADVKSKQEIEDARIKKEEQEADDMFEIRKNRMIKFGFSFSDDSGTAGFLLATTKLHYNSTEIYTATPIEFEEVFSVAEKLLEDIRYRQEIRGSREELFSDANMPLNSDSEVLTFPIGDGTNFCIEYYQIFDATDDQFENSLKIAKESLFKSRVNALKVIGFTHDESKELCFSLCDIWEVSRHDIESLNNEKFVAYLDQCVLARKEYDETKAKADAAKLKAENKARIKKYSADKNALSSFVDSIEFRGVVPEMDNPDSQELLDSIFVKTMEFKAGLLLEIKNL